MVIPDIPYSIQLHGNGVMNTGLSVIDGQASEFALF